MEKPTATARRPGSLTRTACLACRRLKMKCVGADTPPCVRCSNVGRYCVVPTSNQQQQTPTNIQNEQKLPDFERGSTASATAIGSNNAGGLGGPGMNTHCGPRPSPNHNNSSGGVTTSSSRSAIPKGRWLSSLPTVCRLPILPAYNSATLGCGHLHSRSDIVELPRWTHRNRDLILESTHSLPNDEELCHLSRFFIANLMVHIPVLTELDVSDLVAVVKSKRLLAYSMAYVAARFVPGCRAVRITLAPTIRAMVRLQFDHSESSDEQRWTLLQALAVLYSWAAPQHPEAQEDAEIELKAEQLKGSIETLALRYSLHSSAEELARLLKHDPSNLRQTFAFRKYTYWLWFFSLGYFRSLISQTPPSIREDATIAMAPQLLDILIHDDYVRQILARVELCLLWVGAGVRDRGLGEWWCTIPTQAELDSKLAVLDDLDTALQLWRQKWTTPESSSRLEGISKFGRDCSIDVCYYFIRFCVSTYATKLYQSSASTETLLSSLANLVTNSVERASDLCHLLLKLTPLAKSSMRFSPEITFAMVASCCEYLVHVHNSSAELNLLQPSHINAICEVGDLLVDLGVDHKHSAKVYGQSILARLPPTRSGELWQKSHSASSQKNGKTWSMPPGSQGPLSFPDFGGGVDRRWPTRGIWHGHLVSSAEPYGLVTVDSSEGGGLWQDYHGAPTLWFDPFREHEMRPQSSSEFYVDGTEVVTQ